MGIRKRAESYARTSHLQTSADAESERHLADKRYLISVENSCNTVNSSDSNTHLNQTNQLTNQFVSKS